MTKEDRLSKTATSTLQAIKKRNYEQTQMNTIIVQSIVVLTPQWRLRDTQNRSRFPS